jgi:hypothetical protein
MSLLLGLNGGKMFLYTGHLMNDIWFSNIYFHNFDDKESQKVGLSHGCSISY